MYPEIQLIISEKNLGFAGGNNIALNKQRRLYFTNNDTEVKTKLLDSLVELMESDQK
jgi:GT2 family glycosyltransferase